MKTKNIIILVCLAIIVILGWTFLVGKKDRNPLGGNQNQGTINTEGKTTGTVATTTNGQMLYTNEGLGLKLSFPLGWYLGMNTLGDVSGYGYLQLFNYDETKADGKSGFLEGSNKIEAVIVNDNTIATSSDYIEQFRETTSSQIAGQTTTRIDIMLLGGQKSRVYLIPIRSGFSKFLRIGISGDPKNFYILDNIVKSIEWL